MSANLVLVDNETLQARYDEALNRKSSILSIMSFPLSREVYGDADWRDQSCYRSHSIEGVYKDPGIKDGTLFRKNVRQSLGTGNKVNKGIARTLRNNPEEFFFLHNGITAICSSIKLSTEP